MAQFKLISFFLISSCNLKFFGNLIYISLYIPNPPKKFFSAKASYLINGGGGNNDDVGLGITNELMFKASGELDNGFTWNYHTELDPNGGGTTDNDDTALVMGMGDMGGPP